MTKWDVVILYACVVALSFYLASVEDRVKELEAAAISLALKSR